MASDAVGTEACLEQPSTTIGAEPGDAYWLLQQDYATAYAEPESFFDGVDFADFPDEGYFLMDPNLPIDLPTLDEYNQFLPVDGLDNINSTALQAPVAGLDDNHEREEEELSEHSAGTEIDELGYHNYSAFGQRFASVEEAMAYRIAEQTEVYDRMEHVSIGHRIPRATERAYVERLCRAIVNMDTAKDSEIEIQDGISFPSSAEYRLLKERKISTTMIEAQGWHVFGAIKTLHTLGCTLRPKDLVKPVGGGAFATTPDRLLTFEARIDAIEKLLSEWKLCYKDIVAGEKKLEALVRCPAASGQVKMRNRLANKVKQLSLEMSRLRSQEKQVIRTEQKVQIRQEIAIREAARELVNSMRHPSSRELED